MKKGWLSSWCASHLSFFLFAFSFIIYLLTMDRSVSWWDCGEFLATGWTLGVGHPSGAPFYQLVQHVVMLLSFGHPMLVAPLSNALSAVCGGATVGLLYETIRELGDQSPRSTLPPRYARQFTSAFCPQSIRKNTDFSRRDYGGMSEGLRRDVGGDKSSPTLCYGAAIGALCYLFCDTAWFSAVESEVYSMAMLFCALDVWVALRWRRSGGGRWLVLLGLLLGLGTGVHLMTLLTLPAVLLIVCGKRNEANGEAPARAAFHFPLPTFLFIVLFFLIGLTPYAVIPIRAAADPPINEMEGSFGDYLQRKQYEKAPLYPRMWRERDAAHWEAWNGGLTGVAGNAVYYVTYQLSYMYGRYLIYNFAGRENGHWHCVVLFILPLLLALWGLWQHRRLNRPDYWVVMLLFLFGGLLLNLYLNHPCYEPRERDYAYVLSFYAVAIWIGIGAEDVREKMREERGKRKEERGKRKEEKGKRSGRARTVWSFPLSVFLFLAPLTMAVGNWSDHDRSGCHSVHDIAANHLESCDRDAVLITLGDNDTFPLWYMQQVEGRRTDVEVYNVGLTGWRKVFDLIGQADRRPVYFTHYFYQRYAYLFPGRLRCEGFCWRLLPQSGGDLTPVLHDGIAWHITDGEYIDRISSNYLRIWEGNGFDPIL